MTKPAENLTTRLLKFRVKCDVIGVGPSWHTLSLVDVAVPPPALEGWSIAVRGGSVLFLSPPGWTQQGAQDKAAPGEITAFEFARSEIRFVWRMSDSASIDKLSRFDIGPLRRAAQPAEVTTAIDAKDMGDA